MELNRRTCLGRSIIASFEPRDELRAAVKQSVLDTSASTATARSQGQHTTATVGMGGVGKTLSAAALARDPQVGRWFGAICWASVGQAPDLLLLQQQLHLQLTGTRGVAGNVVMCL